MERKYLAYGSQRAYVEDRARRVEGGEWHVTPPAPIVEPARTEWTCENNWCTPELVEVRPARTYGAPVEVTVVDERTGLTIGRHYERADDSPYRHVDDDPYAFSG